MDKKVTGIVAYLTWVGLLIAYLTGDKEGAKFHINQAFVIFITSLISVFVMWIPIIRLAAIIFISVCWVMGLVYAIKEEEKEVPLIGRFKILK